MTNFYFKDVLFSFLQKNCCLVVIDSTLVLLLGCSFLLDLSLDGPPLQLCSEVHHGCLLLHREVVDALYGVPLLVDEGLGDGHLAGEVDNLYIKMDT